MKAEELVWQYIPQIKIMQLATVAGNKPYLCTVHYYSDLDLNFYWCSLLTRRHSQEIKQNPKVAAYILVHENTPEEDYVIGITILGKAELISPEVKSELASGFAKKHGKGSGFVKNAINDETPHKFYQLTPEQVILFDSKNFPDNPRQEWQI